MLVAFHLGASRLANIVGLSSHRQHVMGFMSHFLVEPLICQKNIFFPLAFKNLKYINMSEA